LALKSWKCKGCTNICFQMYGGEVAEYCRPMAEKGSHRTKWIGDTLFCLDYTTDPKATDPQVRMWTEPKKEKTVANLWEPYVDPVHGKRTLTDCFEAVVEKYEDGYMLCPILETGGKCEECMEVFEEREKRKEILIND